MDNLYNYITDPSTLVNIVVFVFGLGVAWSKFNSEIKELKTRIERIEELNLDARLTQIQTDLTRIKATLNEFKQR